MFWEDRDRNLEHFAKHLDQIGETDLIILPETFSTGFSMKSTELAEEMGGKSRDWLVKKAAEKDAAIMASLLAKEGGKFYNRLHFVHPDGKVEIYNKRHLFTMAEEHLHYSAGNELLTVNYKSWRIRPLVCYDLRFPVWSRNKQDYDLLIYIANWPVPRRNAWDILLKARAIENYAYCAGVNRVGKDGADKEYSGGSVLIDPKGAELAKVPDSQEGIVETTLSLEYLERYRAKFPVHQDADEFTIQGL
jgi:omega-amidase